MLENILMVSDLPFVRFWTVEQIGQPFLIVKTVRRL